MRSIEEAKTYHIALGLEYHLKEKYVLALDLLKIRLDKDTLFPPSSIGMW